MTSPMGERTAFAWDRHHTFALPATLLRRVARIPAWVDALFVVVLCVAISVESCFFIASSNTSFISVNSLRQSSSQPS